MFKEVAEAGIRINIPIEEKISSKLPVFYNPLMKLNRDFSVLLLKCTDIKDMRICDLLAGTGVRSVRFLTELKNVESITINDSNPKSAEIIKKNIDLNKKFINPKTEINLSSEDGSLLLLKSNGFGYIEIDPFGTPDPFLDAAAKRIARGGIIAITATDTSALAGTFPDVCKRRYWAIPDRGPLKHEVGLRILIRKVQLVAAQYEKALFPIFSYSKDHYMRVFLKCKKGKTVADKLLKEHGMHNSSGPMYLGQLWDKELVDNMNKALTELAYETDARFLQMIKDECKINCVGFYDIHYLCSKNHIGVPNYKLIFDEVRKKGFGISKTHFSEYGAKSQIPEKEFVEILKKLSNK